jgi:hypothetical protein
VEQNPLDGKIFGYATSNPPIIPFPPKQYTNILPPDSSAKTPPASERSTSQATAKAASPTRTSSTIARSRPYARPVARKGISRKTVPRQTSPMTASASPCAPPHPQTTIQTTTRQPPVVLLASLASRPRPLKSPLRLRRLRLVRLRW